MNLELYFSKVITVPQEKGSERVFLLGGTSDSEATQVVTNCYELVIKKKAELVPIASLPCANVGFGACISSDCSKIYIAGGT
jgi:hypothetical protein